MLLPGWTAASDPSPDLWEGSLDHLVGGGQMRQRDDEIERFGCLHVVIGFSFADCRTGKSAGLALSKCGQRSAPRAGKCSGTFGPYAIMH